MYHSYEKIHKNGINDIDWAPAQIPLTFDDVDENTTVKCSKGVKSDSVFELPTNIEFTSMDDLLNY